VEIADLLFSSSPSSYIPATTPITLYEDAHKIPPSKKTFILFLAITPW
jgi:hypothetical protein